MPLHQTEAVILQSLPFGEADKIISFYTLDYGKMKGIAKSARRSRKRFGNTLEICSHVKVTFFEKETTSLVRLDHCDLIAPFPNLREDIYKLAWASYLLELVNELTGEKIKNHLLFELLIHFLDLIDRRGPRDELKRIFEIRVLTLLGYQPQFNHCTRCERGLAGERFFFGLQEGGVLCLDCGRNLPNLIPVTMGTIKTLHLAQTISIDKLTRITFSAQCLKESQAVLGPFLRQYLGKILKAERFLEQMAIS